MEFKKRYAKLNLGSCNEPFRADVHFKKKKRISTCKEETLWKEASDSLTIGLCSTARHTIVPPLVCHLNRASVKL